MSELQNIDAWNILSLLALYEMQHGFGLLSDVLCDFWDLFHGWLHTYTSKKQTTISTFLMILLIKLLWNMFKRV